MKRWFWLALAIVVFIAAGVTLVAVPRTPEWTTSSQEALDAFEAGEAALNKVYDAEAFKHFEKALAIDPSFAVAKWRVLRFLVDEDPERAQQLVEELMAADLSTLTPRERFFIEYWRAMRNDETVEAARLLDECVENHPDDPYILERKADVAWMQGNLEEAEKLFQGVLKIDPNRVAAYNALGYIKMMQGRFTEAEEHFKSYRFVAPHQANPHDSLGELLITTGRYDEAEASLEKALQIRPDFWPAHYHLTILKIYTRDFETIPTIIERARSAGIASGALLEMQCNAQYAELANREAWRQILDDRESECVEGWKSGLAVVVTHRAACKTGNWKIAQALEDQIAGILLKLEENGDQEDSLVLRAAALHTQGVRLALQNDFAAAEQRFRAADEGFVFTMVDRGMYKLYNRLSLAETLLANGKDADAHQLIANVRGINPQFVREFEDAGLRILGLGRGEGSLESAIAAAEPQEGPATAL